MKALAAIGFVPFALFIGVLIYGSIPSAGDKAEQRLALVRQSGGSKDDICAAAREVAGAYLRALDRSKYPLAKVEADTACIAADLGR